MREASATTKDFPVKQVALQIIVFSIAFVMGTTSSLGWPYVIILAIRRAAIAHERDAFRQELIHVDACARIAKDKLGRLLVCKVGHIHQESRIQGSIASLFDAFVEFVGLFDRLREAVAVVAQEVIAAFCTWLSVLNSIAI